MHGPTVATYQMRRWARVHVSRDPVDPFDREDRMELNAASRPAPLQMIHVEEADAGKADDNALQIVKSIPGPIAEKRIQHPSRGDEPVAIRRCRVLAEIGVVGLDDDVILRIHRVGQYDMDIVVALTFDAGNRAFDAIHAELFVADAAIPCRTAVGRDRIQGGDCRVDCGVKLNTSCSWIAQALDLRTIERTAHRRERAHQPNADQPRHRQVN